MVRQEFALLGQTHGVEAVGLEGADGDVGADGGDHERQEKVVAAGQLGDEEDARQGGVHDGGHGASHAHEGEILFGQVDRQAEEVEDVREEEARDAADVEARGEDATATAAAVGGRRGEDFREEDEAEEDDDAPIAILHAEEGALVHEVDKVAIEQGLDRVVALAVERGEEEDEDAEHGRTEDEALPAVREAGVDPFDAQHGTGEVERDESAEDAQQEDVGDALHDELLGLRKLEHGLGAGEDVRHGGGRDGRDEQGQDGRHRQIEHEHLDDEDQSGDRSLEDTRYGARGTTADE